MPPTYVAISGSTPSSTLPPHPLQHYPGVWEGFLSRPTRCLSFTFWLVLLFLPIPFFYPCPFLTLTRVVP